MQFVHTILSEELYGTTQRKLFKVKIKNEDNSSFTRKQVEQYMLTVNTPKHYKLSAVRFPTITGVDVALNECQWVGGMLLLDIHRPKEIIFDWLEL